MRLPCCLVRIWLSSVVFPEPRKPVMTCGQEGWGCVRQDRNRAAGCCCSAWQPPVPHRHWNPVVNPPAFDVNDVIVLFLVVVILLHRAGPRHNSPPPGPARRRRRRPCCRHYALRAPRAVMKCRRRSGSHPVDLPCRSDPAPPPPSRLHVGGPAPPGKSSHGRSQVLTLRATRGWLGRRREVDHGARKNARQVAGTAVLRPALRTALPLFCARRRRRKGITRNSS